MGVMSVLVIITYILIGYIAQATGNVNTGSWHAVCFLSLGLSTPRVTYVYLLYIAFTKIVCRRSMALNAIEGYYVDVIPLPMYSGDEYKTRSSIDSL